MAIENAIAECLTCGKEWESPRTARKAGYAHARRYGHVVSVDVYHTYLYNGELLEDYTSEADTDRGQIRRVGLIMQWKTGTVVPGRPPFQCAMGLHRCGVRHASVEIASRHWKGNYIL